MKRLLTALSAIAILALPAVATAQTRKAPAKQPGATQWAPGQRAQSPGDAKTYAPGQQERLNDLDGRRGAKEYAPGRQLKK